MLEGVGRRGRRPRSPPGPVFRAAAGRTGGTGRAEGRSCGAPAPGGWGRVGTGCLHGLGSGLAGKRNGKGGLVQGGGSPTTRRVLLLLAEICSLLCFSAVFYIDAQRRIHKVADGSVLLFGELTDLL